MLLVSLAGRDKPHVFSEAYRRVCAAGGEVKEARNSRLGGHYSSLFLVAGTTKAELEKSLAGSAGSVWVDDAPMEKLGTDGPLCISSPELPLVRKVALQLVYEPGVVTRVTEALCARGIIASSLDQHRAGKSVLLEGTLTLPDGLPIHDPNEPGEALPGHPTPTDEEVVQALQSLDVTVLTFEGVEATADKIAGHRAA